MKDGLNQEISVEDKVVWVGGKTQYSGVHVYQIEKITPKRVKLRLLNKKGAPQLQCDTPTVDPMDVVVVNKLLDN